MGARTKARKRALDILFESELRGLEAGATLSERRAGEGPPLSEYTIALVEGVTARLAAIDETIESTSNSWSLGRMPAVDRNILRLGVYELTCSHTVPPAVAINEAVELAKALSTDESPSFVNGVLAKVVDTALR